ncbi:MAG: hypothetical protein ABFD54_05885 [Armatimonadota bacterium]|nr:hypothetical protein [bacterium]
MARINPEWGKCITDLLKRHGLTPRGAHFKAGGEPSHTTIIEWMSGSVPLYKEKAYSLLQAFPRDEAIECLKVVGFPIPPDWQESDPVKAAGQVLFRDMPQNLQGKAKEMVQTEMEKELERIREKYAKKFQN